MDSPRRLIACALVAMTCLGLLPPGALAQRQAVVEVTPPDARPARGTDIYDVGAGVITAARMPFNAVLCGLGTAAGTLLFVVTFGSAYQASVRAIEEGCVSQPWIVRGEDLRPVGAPGIYPRRAPDGSTGRW
jgi:hypothetical protein